MWTRDNLICFGTVRAPHPASVRAKAGHGRPGSGVGEGELPGGSFHQIPPGHPPAGTLTGSWVGSGGGGCAVRPGRSRGAASGSSARGLRASPTPPGGARGGGRGRRGVGGLRRGRASGGGLWPGLRRREPARPRVTWAPDGQVGTVTQAARPGASGAPSHPLPLGLGASAARPRLARRGAHLPLTWPGRAHLRLPRGRTGSRGAGTGKDREAGRRARDGRPARARSPQAGPAPPLPPALVAPSSAPGRR